MTAAITDMRVFVDIDVRDDSIQPGAYLAMFRKYGCKKQEIKRQLSTIECINLGYANQLKNLPSFQYLVDTIVFEDQQNVVNDSKEIIEHINQLCGQYPGFRNIDYSDISRIVYAVLDNTDDRRVDTNDNNSDRHCYIHCTRFSYLYRKRILCDAVFQETSAKETISPFRIITWHQRTYTLKITDIITGKELSYGKEAIRAQEECAYADVPSEYELFQVVLKIWTGHDRLNMLECSSVDFKKYDELHDTFYKMIIGSGDSHIDKMAQDYYSDCTDAEKDENQSQLVELKGFQALLHTAENQKQRLCIELIKMEYDIKQHQDFQQIITDVYNTYFRNMLVELSEETGATSTSSSSSGSSNAPIDKIVTKIQCVISCIKVSIDPCNIEFTYAEPGGIDHSITCNNIELGHHHHHHQYKDSSMDEKNDNRIDTKIITLVFDEHGLNIDRLSVPGQFIFLVLKWIRKSQSMQHNEKNYCMASPQVLVDEVFASECRRVGV